MNKNETPVPHIEHGIHNIRALRVEDLDAVTGGGMLNTTANAISTSAQTQ
jgi:hypothetical protein